MSKSSNDLLCIRIVTDNYNSSVMMTCHNFCFFFLCIGCRVLENKDMYLWRICKIILKYRIACDLISWVNLSVNMTIFKKKVTFQNGKSRQFLKNKILSPHIIYNVYYTSSSQVLFACNSKGKMTYIVLRVKSMYPYDGFLMSLPPCLEVRFNNNNSYKKLGLGPPWYVYYRGGKCTDTDTFR